MTLALTPFHEVLRKVIQHDPGEDDKTFFGESKQELSDHLYSESKREKANSAVSGDLILFSQLLSFKFQ